MKKGIIIFIIICLIISAFVLIPKNKENTEENEYKIYVYNDTFILDSKKCADLTKKEVEEIAIDIFCANHNVKRTFYSYEDLQKKDYQMAVWFKKMKIDKTDKCSKKDFEKIIEDIYNVSYTEHESLENTFEYNNGKYRLIDYEYKQYQIPVIDRIVKEDADLYKVYFTLTNTHINYIHEIEYMATVKREKKNLYIVSVTESDM